MDLETQVEEMDVGVEVEMPRVVDLNLATAEDLQSLPGIGPSLARRIVAYREEQGDFRSPEELTAVPGIGRAAYERLANVLVAAPPEPLPPPVAEEPVLEEVIELAPAVPEAPALPQIAPPAAKKVASHDKILVTPTHYLVMSIYRQSLYRLPNQIVRVRPHYEIRIHPLANLILRPVER